MPKVTQYENVKNYLEQGNKITPIEALNKFGSFRLSAIIFNLRQNGYPIKTHNKTENGKTFAEYELTYDKKNNIIAKGNAKVLYENNIITSNLIIYSKKTGNITLPLEFNFKDKRNNYYYGTSGFFDSSLKLGSINDVKVLFDDGSRIVGNQIKKNNNIEIISKGVYTPCKSKIKIANLICPIWQLESEKMLHDYDKLFLYQKHSKMRIFNFPVLYSPYLF